MKFRIAPLFTQPLVLSLSLLAGCSSVPSSTDKSPSAGAFTAHGKTSREYPSDAVKRDAPRVADQPEVYMYASPKAASSAESDAVAPRSASLEDRISSAEAKRSPRSAPTPSRDAAPLKELSFDALVEEIEARLGLEWASLPGGLGEAEAEEDAGRINSSKRLIAVAFLRDAGESESLEEALQFAMSQKTKSDLKLLATAYLTHAKQDVDARSLLEEICAEGAAEPKGEKDASLSPFEVVSLSFARSIDGPGKFIPASESDVLPGKVLLVYGEFRNFRARREEADQDPPRFRQAFRASLRLLAPSGKEIDELDFLPESRGRQTSSSPLETVNFWARYRMPESLKAGQYRLIVEAEDILGESSATRELSFEIKGPPAQDVDRSEEARSASRGPGPSPAAQGSNRGGAANRKKPGHP